MSKANAWMHYHQRHKGQALATQSRARALNADEEALANALETLFAEGVHDFAEIAEKLTEQALTIPGHSHSQWNLDLLSSTLQAINSDLDDAYAKDGFGA